MASYSLVEIAEELDDPQQRYALDDVRQPPLAERFRVNHSAGAQYSVRWYRFRLDPQFASGTWVLRVPLTTDYAEPHDRAWDGIERFEAK